MKKRRYYFDMDGSLFEWKNVEYFEMLYEKNYFKNLTPNIKLMNVAKALIERGEAVYVLTSYLTDSPYAYIEKNESLDEHLPELSKDNRIFVKYGDDKSKYIEGGITKEDHLIDDYTVNLISWDKDGGSGIKFLNGLNHSKETWEGKTISIESNHLLLDLDELTAHENVNQLPRTKEGSLFNFKLHLTETSQERMDELNSVKSEFDIKILSIADCGTDKNLVEYLILKDKKCVKAGYEIFKNPYGFDNLDKRMLNEIRDLLYEMDLEKKDISQISVEKYQKLSELLSLSNDEKGNLMDTKDALYLSKYELKNSPYIYNDYKKFIENNEITIKKNSNETEKEVSENIKEEDTEKELL